MASSMNRKIIIIAMTVFLLGAGYLNYRYNNAVTTNAKPTNKSTVSANTTAGPQAQTVSANFFANYKAERTNTRKEEIEYLDQVINNTKTDADTLKAAQAQKIQITKIMEQEVTIEGLLQAKGFSQVVVTFSDTSVNVIVGTKQLTDDQVAQILDVVKRSSGLAAENIKIIPAITME